MNDQTTAPGDDLDARLRAFFRAEMPAPWPAFRPPAKASSHPFRGRATAPPRWAGRAALVAASVLVLTAMTLMPQSGAGVTFDAKPLRILGDPTANPRGLPPGGGSTRPGQLTPNTPTPPGHQADRNPTGIKFNFE